MYQSLKLCFFCDFCQSASYKVNLLYVFCILVDWCPEPPRGEGVKVAVSGKRVGSTATYSCQPGFILFGQEVMYNVYFQQRGLKLF